MLKKILLTLSAGLLVGSAAVAQQLPFCGADLHHKVQIGQFPNILQKEQELEAYIKNYMMAQQIAKPNPLNLDDTLHIPVVVHVVHNGGAEFISDAQVYTMMANLNTVYLKRNSDTANVIPLFKPYIGKPNIIFHLATKDPLGNPSRGIVRHFTYLSSGGNNQAKIEQWAPYRYLNIWIVKSIDIALGLGSVAAYATFPAGAAADPSRDGVLVGYQSMNDNKTVEHEVGHYLNLQHPWNSSGQGACVACGDDEVDDTPPTRGHFPTSAAPNCGNCAAAATLYDTICTNVEKEVGKAKLDSQASKVVVDDIDNKSIDFITRSRLLIESVKIYPASTTPIGTPFQIVLKKKNGPILATFNDTVKQGSPNNNYFQICPVNFYIPNWDTTVGFQMILTQNPGCRRDTVDNAIATNVFGAITLKKITDDTLYNYMYNWKIRHYYFKVNPTNINDIIDYPDTANTQNIMDYANCPIMFTKGQVERMRIALNSNLASRSNLWDSTNLVITGAGEKLPDLTPVADFAITNGRYYVCADGATTVQLRDYSWNDTITSREWSGSSGVSFTGTNTALTNATSTQVGWATISLKANSNVGSNTTSKQNIYFANPNATAANGYYQEFADNNVNNNWPIFNIYNNNFKWSVADNGYYDGKCYAFNGFDGRLNPDDNTGYAKNDIDEFYSPVMDMTTVPGTNKYLNFLYAGAYRVNNASYMNDSLVVSYSIDCGANWFRVNALKGSQIATVGTLGIPFAPLAQQDWQPKGFLLPAAAANSSKVMFRFRYFSNPHSFDGFNSAVLPTSNNFFIDRIHFREWAMNTADLALEHKNISIAPNPTTSSATVYMDLGNVQQEVRVHVMDVTGKLVFSASTTASGKRSSIEIPSSALQAKGVYMVQVMANGKSMTERLVVK